MANGNGNKTDKVSQDEINGILWKACDTFRGAVDPSEYKNYILVMLFVKYISDVWHDHYAKLVEEYGDPKSKTAKERIERRLKRERFVLPEHCTFGSLYEQRNDANIGEIINTALDDIEDSNKKKLEGVFRNIDFNSEASLGQTKERNSRLKSLMEDFNDSRLDLRPSRVGKMDVIGDAYEYLIGEFAAGAGKKAGEFYTPPEVSQLIARLIVPQPGERICDPACGSGSLLIKCGHQVGSNDYSLFGQEINGSTWALAKMNMFLHAMDNARIEWGDTIRNPKLISDDRLMKFEVVVANPPFSLDKWGQEEARVDEYNRFHRGVPPKNKGDFAFISHMVESVTAESGRVAVVTPHGILFRSRGEGAIRRKLVDEGLLDTVIGLPPDLFYGTELAAAILVFRRQRQDDKVLFVDASGEYADCKKHNRLRAGDIERIVDACEKRTNIPRYSFLASQNDIERNGYNLNIPRYVDTYEEPVPIDLEDVASKLDQVEHRLVAAEQHLEECLRGVEHAN
ncbi:Type I restriction enzyme EcoKI M protein [Symmachiella macrocystis]|uniref:site-specific DNA-methyltransferase (adenine-specific) n=1 Tax=Symmachiella macrocystis TaxID=2527985 RepID=A0A5C6BC63_9PLAN|nr:type I restriction-modification system subunit M [Symmachiella macrocystis]TWU08886.1 Type I restriction enzyme EcoKI M protein [Symmachiella macrocystis]